MKDPAEDAKEILNRIKREVPRITDKGRRSAVAFGESGKGDEAMEESHVFVALVTDSWINDNGCVGQAEYAQKLDKPMVAVIQTGTKDLEKIDRFHWVKKYFFSNAEELEKVTEEILKKEIENDRP